MLEEAYYESKGVLTNDESEAIAPMLYRPSESNIKKEEVKNLIKLFRSLDISEYGLTLESFLRLPLMDLNLIIETATEDLEERLKAQEGDK